jgi:hypothetical protein
VESAVRASSMRSSASTMYANESRWRTDCNPVCPHSALRQCRWTDSGD